MKNIAISGWNGAGSTTISLLLANELNYKIVQTSQTARTIGKILNYSNEGIGRIEADEFLEQVWWPLVDAYHDVILLNEKGILLESDLAAYGIGKRNEFYSVFLYASFEERIRRLGTDDREDDIKVLKERDESLRKIYLANNHLDWFDLNLINEKYNLPIDNANYTIAGTLDLIFQKLVENNIISSRPRSGETLESEFWKNGKQFYIDSLKEKGLYSSAEEIIVDVLKTFPDKAAALPDRIKSALNSLNINL